MCLRFPLLPCHAVIFQIYDVDHDGVISADDLFFVMKLMCGVNLDDVQLQRIVEATIKEADLDQDGKLNMAEFEQAIASANETNQLTMKFF